MEKGVNMMNRIPKFGCRGVTLVEILMVLGLLTIIASFALPSMSSASAKTDMRAASENLQYSIRIARNTARMAEAVVSMNLLDEPGDAGQRITFSASERAVKSLGQPDIPDYQFSENIKFVSEFPSYEFDHRGLVKNPGQITLVSMADKSVTAQIMVD
jgi:prepilin-type N-terminal cleavage/methylation domain-containing protein